MLHFMGFRDVSCSHEAFPRRSAVVGQGVEVESLAWEIMHHQSIGALLMTSFYSVALDEGFRHFLLGSPHTLFAVPMTSSLNCSCFKVPLSAKSNVYSSSNGRGSMLA